MLWCDGQEYGSSIVLPAQDDLTTRDLLERDLHKEAGNFYGDVAEMIGEMVGRSIADTIRTLAGVDELGGLDAIQSDADLEAVRQRFAAASKMKA
jgi:hypothetical protein